MISSKLEPLRMAGMAARKKIELTAGPDMETNCQTEFPNQTDVSASQNMVCGLELAFFLLPGSRQLTLLIRSGTIFAFVASAISWKALLSWGGSIRI
jgi:hypothetical protein